MDSDNMEKHVLHVKRSCSPRMFDADHLEFVFSEGEGPGGFRAWKSESGLDYYIEKGCENIAASFSQQALNYPVARRLVERRYRNLVISEINGATIDLPRVCTSLKVNAWFVLSDQDIMTLAGLSGDEFSWAKDSLSKCSGILLSSVSQDSHDALSRYEFRQDILIFDANVFEQRIHECSASPCLARFDYTIYEMVLRDHPLLHRMQVNDARHFLGCLDVLDLGCGVGVFLDILRSKGISARGVERSHDLVSYGEAMGLNFICEDAVSHILSTDHMYDGIYCSHFVEHLPIELVEKLISGMSRVMLSGGVAVLTFPDPESIRSQLLGFWRDPEHVRFYHPELIVNIARANGFVLEWSSYEDNPHDVTSFPVDPPAVDVLEKFNSTADSLWQKLMAVFGLVTNRQWKEMQSLLAQQALINRQLVERTEKLWQVNKTWAWNDNVTLKLRKR